ncbi:MAG: TIGR00159 family protein [Phycisphaerae bacterium]|nr:TIGR00159 family protein [Phycisphaerae bacterium]
MPERLNQLLSRLADYPWWEVALEVLVLWVLVYAVLRFVRGTRAAGALKGMVILFFGGWLAVRLLSMADLLPRLAIIYNTLLGYAAIALVVTFQPELRRALIRLGETPFLWGQGAQVRPIVDAITESIAFLSKNRFGAILAIERNVGLRDAIETGRRLNADLSPELLSSIFWPNNPLHDMGVVIRGDKIVAASVPFPLADSGDMPDERLGTRHRAAVGLARSTDSIVIVVSEETGTISLAEGTSLTRGLTPDALKAELLKRLGQSTPRLSGDGPPGGIERRGLAPVGTSRVNLGRRATDV